MGIQGWPQLVQCLFEIGNQVVRIFKPDMQAQHGAMRGDRQGPGLGQIDGNHEALETAPGGADAKQAQGIDNALHVCVGDARGELQRQQAIGA